LLLANAGPEREQRVRLYALMVEKGLPIFE
jgi:hypothetical protein